MKIALNHAVHFREAFVFNMSGVDFKTFNENWKTFDFDGVIPKLPKDLDSKVPTRKLEEYNIDRFETMKIIYKHLLEYTVALDVVAYDRELKKYSAVDFKRLLEYSWAFLCDIFITDHELGNDKLYKIRIPHRISPSVKKQNSQWDRDARDWIIFRDFMNELQFCIEVLEYISESLPDSAKHRISCKQE